MFATGPPVCIHCKRKRSIRARGLCKACYQRLDVRALYARSSTKNRGLGRDITNPKPARNWTSAEPGSIEKMAVMQARLMRGEDMHHPLDVHYSPVEIRRFRHPS